MAVIVIGGHSRNIGKDFGRCLSDRASASSALDSDEDHPVWTWVLYC